MESSPRLEEPQQQLNKDERAAFQLTVYYCKCDTLCLCIFNGNDQISVINTCNFMDSCLHGFFNNEIQYKQSVHNSLVVDSDIEWW